jgi:uncharacterized protein YqjF (DUF2071 family)
MMRHSLLDVVDHRPTPLPDAPWIMAMQWRDLLFAHWPVAVKTLRSLIPACLEIDAHDGTGWVGVVPLTMSGVRLRRMPAIPSFPELNLRTYVRYQDRPGVWFFSLDAHSRLAVATARTFFHLPYFNAEMSSRSEGDAIHYTSRRTHRNAAPASLEARYRPTGDAVQYAPGSIEHFLTERYCLYTTDRQGRLRRGEIHHRPWPLQPAEARFTTNTLAAASGIHLPDAHPLCHYAHELDVVAWTAGKV